jgi:4-aminobutyrate aminotransferase-like enzyme
VSGNIIRILPPLVLSKSEADEALSIIDAGIAYAQETVHAPAGKGTGWM